MIIRSLEQEFKTNYNLFYAYALCLTKDHGKTEDLIQDVFLKLVESEKKNSLCSISNLVGYIKVAIRNSYIKELKNNQRLTEYKEKQLELIMGVKSDTHLVLPSIWDLAEQLKLDSIEKAILENWMSGFNQKDSAENLNLENSDYVRKIRQRIKRKLIKAAVEYSNQQNL